MSSADVPVTLADLMRSVFPDAHILAGENHLTRPVNWIVTFSVGSANERAILPGDFAILLPPYSPDLLALLTRLATRGATGAAIVASAPSAAIETAATQRLALLSLPENTDVRVVEQAALRMLVNRSANLQVRAANVYARLAQMFVEGLGLDAMAEELERVTRKIVLIQDKRLRPIAVSIPPDLSPQWAQIEEELERSAALPESLRDRKRAALQSQPTRQKLSAPMARLIAPINAKGMARGFLSLIAPASAFDAFDELMAERGAAACALEMAKAKAVREVEKRVHGDFVDAILAGNLSRAEAARWAARIAFPETGACAAITLAWASAEHPTLRRLDTIVSGELRAKTVRAHARAREDEIVIFVALDPARGIEPARKLAERIARAARDEFPQAHAALGLGRVVTDLLALRESYRQALQARTMAARLSDPNALYFGDLSVYRLLFQLEHSPELETFCREILGPIIEHDRSQKANLLETLTVYFAHRENVTQTAKTLHLHRNSLLYRLARVNEITRWDLANPETRLAVQLALRAYRLV